MKSSFNKIVITICLALFVGLIVGGTYLGCALQGVDVFGNETEVNK